MKIIDKASTEGKHIIQMFINAKDNRVQLPSLDIVFNQYDFKQLARYNACYKLIESYINLCNVDCRMRRIPEDWGIINHFYKGFSFGAIINCHSKDFSIEEFEYILIDSNNNIIKVC